MKTESVLAEILSILGATPTDYVIVSMGFSVVLFTIFLYRQNKELWKKYHILNTNHMALWMKIDPESVKWHHSGDYHIEVKGKNEAQNKAY